MRNKQIRNLNRINFVKIKQGNKKYEKKNKIGIRNNDFDNS